MGTRARRSVPIFKPMSISKWFSRENADRIGLTFEQFVVEMEKEGIPNDISAHLYRYLSQDYSNRSDSTLHPDDALYGTYRMDEEDEEDAVAELALMCRCEAPTTQLVGHMPLVTVRDMARILTRLRPEKPNF
jgi:hypothetical protein